MKKSQHRHKARRQKTEALWEEKYRRHLAYQKSGTLDVVSNFLRTLPTHPEHGQPLYSTTHPIKREMVEVVPQ